MDARDGEDAHWIPDDPDGSGWADVDWVSVTRGSRYHYQHAPGLDEARTLRPAFYRVVTRLESGDIRPHENTYFARADELAHFLAELVWSGGAEVIWHVEPCEAPPAGASVQRP